MRLAGSGVWWLTGLMLLLGSVWPASSLDLAISVALELITLLPLIVLVALMAGWLAVSAMAERFRGALEHRPWQAIFFAGLIGTVTPVCGIASVPLVAALLRQGVPIAAAMAFWLSSPITDPGMLLLTANILSWPFAVALLIAAMLLGVTAGAVTHALCRWRPQAQWVRAEAAQAVPARQCEVSARSPFWAETLSTFALVLRWLAFALTIEALVRAHLGEAVYSLLTNVDSVWAVPLAVGIGGPLYIEGYAALPLLRGLMDMGLTPGAAMAFLIAGAAISLYAAVAVWSLVRPAIFGLYLVLGIVGALVAGWVTDIVVHLG
ncbi:permease [Chromohalobacter israelensis]|uniref:permease n=1 Tax=Chromohalobacter israelensis TaxID=141390 RepID=UPI0006897E2F|nr:permease [Chromohalobacter israelensis]MDF9433183.1 permease [Chromohalobacter israelensis]